MEHLPKNSIAKIQLKRVEIEATSVLDQITFAKKVLAIEGISEISLEGILGEAIRMDIYKYQNVFVSAVIVVRLEVIQLFSKFSEYL